MNAVIHSKHSHTNVYKQKSCSTNIVDKTAKMPLTGIYIVGVSMFLGTM